LHCAVTRQTTEGEPAGGWVPHQKVGVETALRAYTVLGAYASYEQKEKGRLVPGMLADVIVFSQNVFEAAPPEIYKTRVLMTLLDGRMVFQDPSFERYTR